jgi:hypothetical protein
MDRKVSHTFGRTAHNLWSALLARRWSWGAVLLCLTVLLVRFAQIDAGLPYSFHVDEQHVTGSALRVLKGPDRNPKFFNYGSLPIYAAAGAIAVGSVRAARHQELRKIEDVKQVKPYYSHPKVIASARKLHAFVGVLGLWLVGSLAAFAFKQPSLRLLAPALLLLSGAYSKYTWTYFNVDIWAATLTLATVLWVIATFHRRSFIHKAAMPAALAAAAIGSKYTAVVAAVPCLVAIALTERPRQRLPRASQFVLLLCVFFVIYCPYSLLDTPRFLNAVIHEARHYATGHGSFTIAPGWPHLVRIGSTVWTEFGPGFVGALAIGVMAGARADWKRTLVLLSPVVGWIVLMVGQSIFFVRNSLPLLAALVPVAAFGLLSAARLSRRWLLVKFGQGLPKLGLVSAHGLAFISLIVLPVGVNNLRGHFELPTDSRKQVVAWINRNAQPGDLVVVDGGLQADWRGLRGGIQYRRENLLKKPDLSKATLIVARDQKLSKSSSQALATAQPVARFGSKNPQSTFLVDPRLKVYRLAQ